MRISVANLLLALLLFPLAAEAVEGDVWGTWAGPDTVYVTGEIRVPPCSTLVIEPRVVVNFQGHYKFIVDSLARLRAVGTETDSIYFTTDDPTTGWHGMRFYKADSSSQISYCRLEYGKATGAGEDAEGGAIYCHKSDLRISNNIISGNSSELGGGGIYCGGSNVRISDNLICSNSAGTSGGGVDCHKSSGVISDNTIRENSASEHGGGIHCWSSSPTISSNIISGNSADDGGGIGCKKDSNPTITNNSISGNWDSGIYCSQSSPIIDNNTINGNSSFVGGGVYCYYYSSPTISGNCISGNSALEGGGVYCLYYCSPTIGGNSISNNSARFDGGGISCDYWCCPIISGNTISRNSADNNGGGICCDLCSPTINGNCISRNSALDDGGGILCARGNARITHNTMWRNTAYTGYGGGIAAESGTAVANTIIWRNWDLYGAQISGTPTVTYCDVQGGWEGEGNIDCDPEFVNPDSGNFHLQMTSCCIDSGNPEAQYNDPDSTRADIGAFYFRQQPPATVELMPHENVIILPPEGGRFSYDAWIYNLTGSPTTVDVWAYAFVPGIGRYGPIRRYNNVRVRRWNDLGRNNLSQQVPSLAPAGEYTYVGYIGDFGVEIIDSSYFTFTKLGAPGGEDLGWLASGDWFDIEELALEDQIIIPTHSALMHNYPNPFNAKTTISYQLSAPDQVKLEVYNLLGRKVATLVDERQEAGYKSVIWHASEVSSGLYFYKLTAGEFTQTRRMMLVK